MQYIHNKPEVIMVKDRNTVSYVSKPDIVAVEYTWSSTKNAYNVYIRLNGTAGLSFYCGKQYLNSILSQLGLPLVVDSAEQAD